MLITSACLAEGWTLLTAYFRGNSVRHNGAGPDIRHTRQFGSMTLKSWGIAGPGKYVIWLRKIPTLGENWNALGNSKMNQYISSYLST